MKYKVILSGSLILAVISFMLITRNVESTVEISEENPQKIVVTIGEPVTLPAEYRAMLSNADSFRDSWNFRDAKVIYKELLSKNNIDVESRKEMRYNIGFCEMYTGGREKAVTIFNGLMTEYPDDGEARSYCEYCLAWMDVQNKDFQSAFVRLQKILDDKPSNNDEVYAQVLYKIGQIHLAFLNEPEIGKEYYRKVMNDYPDAEITAHISEFLGEKK